MPYKNDLLVIKEIAVINNHIKLLGSVVGNLTYCKKLDSYVLARLERCQQPCLIDYNLIDSQPL